MTNLIETPTYEPAIYQLETDDPGLGGQPAIVAGEPVAGWANAQALQLANRTAYLKGQIENLPNTSDPLLGDALVGVRQPLVNAVARTQHQKNQDLVSIFDFADQSIAGGTIICDTFIQAALNSGAKHVYLPPGTFLCDNDLLVPAGVTFYGSGSSSNIRMVGRDTHGRNCALFTKYENISTSAAPCMVVLTGSNSVCRDMSFDGNGLNNYDDVAGPSRDYLNETTKHGYGAGRIGRMTNRQPADPLTFITNSHFINCSATLTAWGGFIIAGFGYRFAAGDVRTDEDLIGADNCTLDNCRTTNTFSNNIATFSAKNFKIINPVVVNNVHKGIAVYVRCRDGEIINPTYEYDPATDVSWRYGQTVAYNREAEFNTRSDAIAIGHSDYDTLIKNILVSGGKLNGNGMIRNGVNIYSNTSNITVNGLDTRGFISPLTIGVSADLSIKSNTLDAVNYTTTDLSPGTEYFGSNIQYSARSIETTKTAPATTCVQAIQGNTFKGSGVNHVRGNDWSVWNALGVALQSFYSGNTYSDLNLSTIGAETIKPVNLNNKPTSASQSSITFDSEMHYGSTGRVSDGATIFFTNQLWTFVRPMNYHFAFTPSVVGSTVVGVATGTSKGIYTVDGAKLVFSMEASWSAHTGTGNLRMTGLPIVSKSTGAGNVPTSLAFHHSGLAFPAQTTAQLNNNATTVDFLSMASDVPYVNIPLDTSVAILRVSGTYFI